MFMHENQHHLNPGCVLNQALIVKNSTSVDCYLNCAFIRAHTDIPPDISPS